MVGCSVNTVLERMWKDVVLAEFEVLLWHLPEWSEEKSQTPAKIIGLRFLTWDFPKKKLNYKQPNHDIHAKKKKKCSCYV